MTRAEVEDAGRDWDQEAEREMEAVRNWLRVG